MSALPVHTPLGILLNNPGCMEHSDTVYLGEVVPSSNLTFKQFSEPKFGLRAIVRDLQAYWSNDGVSTVAEAITRWAPPSDGNPTEQYIQNVATACLVDANTPVTLTTVLRPMVKAIVKQETGQWPYSDELLEQAIELSESA